MSTKKRKQFMSLYEPIHGRFERFCKARVYGQLDFRDVMQESIAIAFEKFDSIRNHEAFLHFLFGISTRVISNSSRKLHEERLPELFDRKDTGYISADKQLEIDDLYVAIGKLPEQQREAIILFEISGFSVKEIATIQEASEEAIKKRLQRARQELMQLMTEKATIKTKVS